MTRLSLKIITVQRQKRVQNEATSYDPNKLTTVNTKGTQVNTKGIQVNTKGTLAQQVKPKPLVR